MPDTGRVREVVDPPGHTAGHVSFLLDRGGGRVRPTPKVMTADRVAARASVAELAALDFDVAVFGHGTAVKGRAVDRFRDLAAKTAQSQRPSRIRSRPGSSLTSRQAWTDRGRTWK
jgi:glyoxylase-like metal-dependent hydrolase (beta-lactamase superfamily II)